MALFQLDQPDPDQSPWIALLFLGLVHGVLLVVFTSSRLHVEFSDDGLRIRFAPFHRTGRFVPWSEVRRITLRTVRPFGEFGGWGIRWNFGNRMGYVWNADTGVQLDLMNGKSIVVTVSDLKGARQFLHDRVLPVHTDITVDER